jgi:inhibitor of KinA
MGSERKKQATIYFRKMATPESETIEFQPASDQSLLIYLGKKIGVATREQVIRLLHLLEAEPIAGIRNVHPAYCSILLDFDALSLTHEKLTEILKAYLTKLNQVSLPKPPEVEIPVCYGGEFGPDLEEVARLRGMTPQTIADLHSSVTYVAYFLGFVPGFAYLGELPAALVTPRVATPRRNTPPGSVGIADNQTGVYPFNTPGGWRLIGRTPLAMFRPDRKDMSLLAAGDRVRFVPISAEQFAELKNA